MLGGARCCGIRRGFVLAGPRALGDPAQAGPRLVDAALRRLGSNVRVIAVSGAAPAIVAALTMATHMADLLSGDLVALDERAAGLHLTRGGADVTSSIPHALLYAVSGAGSYLVYGPSPGGPVDLDVTVANAAAPTVRDPRTGETTPLPVRRGADGALRLTLPAAATAMVLDFSFGSANQYTMSSEARQETLPRVEEIVARYQQVQAAQDAALESYIAEARMEQHFHPSPADPAYNIVTENRVFADRAGVEWEELSFALNGAKWGVDRPPFPLLQPEKVLSLPLDLRLNEDYRYRLDGVQEVGGRSAYVVRFDPVSASAALYRGTVWIDRRSYVRLKVQAVETHLTGPVVSN